MRQTPGLIDIIDLIVDSRFVGTTVKHDINSLSVFKSHYTDKPMVENFIMSFLTFKVYRFENLTRTNCIWTYIDKYIHRHSCTRTHKRHCDFKKYSVKLFYSEMKQKYKIHFQLIIQNIAESYIKTYEISVCAVCLI